LGKARVDAGDSLMLDATNSRLPVTDIDDGYLLGQENPGPNQLSFRPFLERFRQRRRMMMALTLVGAVVGWLAGLAMHLVFSFLPGRDGPVPSTKSSRSG